MIKILTLLIALLVFPLALLAQTPQDTIITTSGEEIHCYILKTGAKGITYNLKSNGLLYKLQIPDSEVAEVRYGYKVRVNQSHKYLGFGMGLDYGGMPGLNLMYNPTRALGFYAGVGNAFVGVGINGGITYRFMSRTHETKVVPYITGMYGYNTAIRIFNHRQLNKLFYGATVGAGFEFHTTPERLNHWCFTVLIPVRDSDVNQYIDHLESNHGVSFSSKLLPVLLSVGYKYAF